MKKILIIFLGILAVSCSDDFLDQVPDDRLTFEETFSKRNTVEQYLANVYSQIPNEMSQRYVGNQNAGPWMAASDEAEYQWGGNFANNMNIGDWNPTTGTVSSLWSNFYRGIRAASTFINNVDLCENCSQDEISWYKAEAKVLRGYLYYNLLRSYGPVVVIGDTPIAPDADPAEIRRYRNTLEENVAYILKDLEEGAAALTDRSFLNQNAGRMSRPFALAIKEKTLLFAASPLFNGNTYAADLVNAEGVNLIPQTYDANKWKRAADAAKAFIDEYVPGTFELYKEFKPNGDIDAYLSTRNLMLNEWNSEWIYARVRSSNFYQYDITPYHQGSPGDIKGGGALGATQAMVDAYFTSNGRSIDDPQSGYQEDGFSNFQSPFDVQQRQTYNPWVNREARFYVGITYNNSLWLNRNFGNVVTELWYHGNSGRNVGGNDYSSTGYVVRKNMPLGPWSDANRAVVMMRLGEIYLDYVEALNEYEPGNQDILLYLNKIRERAGIPEYGSEDLAAPTGQSEMREAIRKERRVELAFENVRYFDARRWMIAEEDFAGAFYGLDINATNQDDFYNRVSFENRIFDPKHYFWPIPQDELNSNPNLQQNPFW